VSRGGDEIEELRWYFRVLDVQTDGVGDALDYERNGNAFPPDGIGEAGPRLLKWFVGDGRAERELRRDMDL
jgi:hypothetical protein